MKFRIKHLKSVVLRWLIVIFSIFISFAVCIIRARPIVISYAKSHAKAQMISAFDEAVKSAITSLDYGYDDMALITRLSDNTVASIEVDYQKLNILRAEISRIISQKASEKSDNILNIPIGTLLGSEYTTGYGPVIKFKMKYSQMPVLGFQSKFTSAGINSIFHQIIIKANLSGEIIMLGADRAFSVELTTIVAQTVISGAVPENFTNVVETPYSNVADDIFNFSN